MLHSIQRGVDNEILLITGNLLSRKMECRNKLDVIACLSRRAFAGAKRMMGQVNNTKRVKNSAT
jgi:hypothetical protein